MYVTQNNRQREIVRQRGGEGGYRQIDVCNIEQQIEKKVRQRGGGGGSYRQIDVCNIEQQIERDSQIERRRRRIQIDRCIQHRIIDREIVRQRGGGGYRQIDVCNIEQQIDREIVRQRGGGGGYRQIDVYNIEQQIERDCQIERRRRQLQIDRCIQHRTIDKERDSQIEWWRRIQIDRCM